MRCVTRPIKIRIIHSFLVTYISLSSSNRCKQCPSNVYYRVYIVWSALLKTTKYPFPKNIVHSLSYLYISIHRTKESTPFSITQVVFFICSIFIVYLKISLNSMASAYRQQSLRLRSVDETATIDLLIKTIWKFRAFAYYWIKYTRNIRQSINRHIFIYSYLYIMFKNTHEYVWCGMCSDKEGFHLGVNRYTTQKPTTIPRVWPTISEHNATKHRLLSYIYIVFGGLREIVKRPSSGVLCGVAMWRFVGVTHMMIYIHTHTARRMCGVNSESEFSSIFCLCVMSTVMCIVIVG